MPVEFLTDAQAASYGGYAKAPSEADLDRFFLLDDKALGLIEARRLPHTRLGFAVQLTTLLFVGTFLADPTDVPTEVVDYLAVQPGVEDPSCVKAYGVREMTRLEYAREIRDAYGFGEFASVEAELARWVDDRAWTTGDGPGRRPCSTGRWGKRGEPVELLGAQLDGVGDVLFQAGRRRRRVGGGRRRRSRARPDHAPPLRRAQKSSEKSAVSQRSGRIVKRTLFVPSDCCAKASAFSAPRYRAAIAARAECGDGVVASTTVPSTTTCWYGSSSRWTTIVTTPACSMRRALRRSRPVVIRMVPPGS